MSDSCSDAPSDESHSDAWKRAGTTDCETPALRPDETGESRQQNDLLRRRIYEYLLGKTIVPGSATASDSVNDMKSLRNETSTLKSEDFHAPKPVACRIIEEIGNSNPPPRLAGLRQSNTPATIHTHSTTRPQNIDNLTEQHLRTEHSHDFLNVPGADEHRVSAAAPGSFASPVSSLSSSRLSSTPTSGRTGTTTSGSYYEVTEHVYEEGDHMSQLVEADHESSSHDSDGQSDVYDYDSTSRGAESGSDVGSERSPPNTLSNEHYEHSVAHDFACDVDTEGSDGYYEETIPHHGILDDSEYHESTYFDQSERSEEATKSRRSNQHAVRYLTAEGYTDGSEYDEEDDSEHAFMPGQYKEVPQSLNHLPIKGKQSEKRLSLSSHFSAQTIPKDDSFQLDNISLPSWQMHGMDETSRADYNVSSAGGLSPSALESDSTGSSTIDDEECNRDKRDNGSEQLVRLQNGLCDIGSERPSESQRIEELAERQDCRRRETNLESPPPATPQRLLQKLPDAVAQSLPALDFRPTIPPSKGKAAQGESKTSRSEGIVSHEASDASRERQKLAPDMLASEMAAHHESNSSNDGHTKSAARYASQEDGSGTDNDGEHACFGWFDKGNGGRPSLVGAMGMGLSLDDGPQASESQRILLYADVDHQRVDGRSVSPLPTMPTRPMQKLPDAIAYDLPSGDFRPSQSPPTSADFYFVKSEPQALTHETRLAHGDSCLIDEEQASGDNAFEPSNGDEAAKEFSQTAGLTTVELPRSERFLHEEEAVHDTTVASKTVGKRSLRWCVCVTLGLGLLGLVLGIYFGVRDERQQQSVSAVNVTSMPSSSPPSLSSLSPSSIPSMATKARCSDAVQTQVGGTIYSGNFSSASSSIGNGRNIEFDGSDIGLVRSDLYRWYTFLGTNLYTTLRYCWEGDASLDAPWIFTGECDGLLQDIRLSQPVTKSSVDEQCSNVSFRSQSNVEYKVLFHSVSQNTTFYFFLMDNRNCEFASPLDTLNAITQRTYETNSTAPRPATCSNNSFAGVGTWYTIQGTGAEILVSTCGSIFAESEVAIYSGDCSNLQCESPTNQGDCDDSQNSFAAFTSALSVSHLVYVQAGFQGIIGAVLVTAEQTNSSETELSGCSEASLVTLGEQVQDVVEAMPLPVSALEEPATCTDSNNNLVVVQSGGSWYQLLGTGTQVKLDTICQNSSRPLRISVYRAKSRERDGCINYRCVVASSNGCGSSLEWFAKLGKPYFITFHVPSEEEASVTFEFSLLSISARSMIGTQRRSRPAQGLPGRFG